MAVDLERSDDLVLLNAFVDGELSPAHRAALAARLAADPDFAHAHATLARLKACVAAGGEDRTAITLPQRRWRLPLGALAAAAAAIACVAILAGADLARRRAAMPAEPGPATAVTLANLPAHPLLPHLDLAGLTLIGISVVPAGSSDPGPIVVATYRGPHGCRIDLSAGPVGRDLPLTQGSSRHDWTHDGVHYALVSFGMAQARFDMIAQAAENQTRRGSLPQSLERRLREARASAPPCTG